VTPGGNLAVQDGSLSAQPGSGHRDHREQRLSAPKSVAAWSRLNDDMRRENTDWTSTHPPRTGRHPGREDLPLPLVQCSAQDTWPKVIAGAAPSSDRGLSAVTQGKRQAGRYRRGMIQSLHWVTWSARAPRRERP